MYYRGKRIFLPLLASLSGLLGYAISPLKQPVFKHTFSESSFQQAGTRNDVLGQPVMMLKPYLSLGSANIRGIPSTPRNELIK